MIALTPFHGREAPIVLLNAMMGLPPVVVGLAVYLLLARSGPLGALSLLFAPPAMVIAQTILMTPIIAALTRQTIEDLWAEYSDELTAMNVGGLGRMATLIWDGRFSLVVAPLAGSDARRLRSAPSSSSSAATPTDLPGRRIYQRAHSALAAAVGCA